MYNYRLVLSVKNSAGNELHKSWNFSCRIKEHCILHRILDSLHKKNYHRIIHSGWKNSGKNVPISFEELCQKVKDFRFYEQETIVKQQPKYSLEYVFTMPFPCEVTLDKYFHSDWGGTFFELTTPEESLVKIDYEKIANLFKTKGLDLLKSKTDGLWYTHYFIEMTSIEDGIAISRRSITYERVIDKVITEL